MTTYYLHTLDDAPAYFDENMQEILFCTQYGKAAPLAKSLRQIRREQHIDKGNSKIAVTYGYKRVAVPDHDDQVTHD